MTLADHLQRTFEQRAGEPALRCGDRELAWGDVARIAQDLERALCDSGAGAGAPVGLVARNDLATACALAALWAHGRCAVLLSGHLPAPALADELPRHALAALVGGAADFEGALGAAADGSSLATVALDGDGLATPRRATTRTQARAVHGHALDIATSGTTGTPKRVRHRADTVLAAALAEEVGVADAERDLPAARQRLPFINFYPLANIAGTYFWAHACVSGRPTVLQPKFGVEAWRREVERLRPPVLYIPPAAIAMVVEAGLPRGTLDGARLLRAGNAPLPDAVRERFETEHGIPIACHYGATEFCGVVTSWTLDDLRRHGAGKRGALGRARPGVALRVVDPAAGAPLAAGETGVLEVRAERVGPDWMRTGDVARVDADGYLFISGRADDAINRGGFKVAPERVAEVLREHPAVREAAVVGIADAVLGQVPAAAVVVHDGVVAPVEADLLAHARRHLAAYQVPVAVHVVDALPRTPSLKLDRARLRALLDPANEETTR